MKVSIWIILIERKAKMERKQTRLEKILDKDVNIYQIGIIEYNFFDGRRLNAKGRFYTKMLLMLFSLIYFITEKNAIMSACMISVLSFMIPALINIAGKTVVEKMHLRDDNIYDITAAVGGYALVLAPPIIAMLLASDMLAKSFADIFLSLNTLTEAIIAAGIIGILADGMLMCLENKNLNKVRSCLSYKQK